MFMNQTQVQAVSFAVASHNRCISSVLFWDIDWKKTEIHDVPVSETLRGYCTSYPKKLQNYHVFCSVSNLSTYFWKIIYASYRKLSKELKNSIKIKVGQAILELWIKTNILTVLICNLRTTWPTKIPMPFLSSLNNFVQGSQCTIYFQKVVDNFQIEHKTC